MARHQHYVPRKYLRPWATDEKIWCGRGTGPFNPNIMGIAQERYFYKLERLNSDDFALAHAIIVAPLSNQLLKLECEATLKTYKAMFDAEHEISDMKFSKMFDDFLLTVDDDIITAIESDLFPFLDQANSGDLSFLDNLTNSSRFYHGLMLQYFRTHKIRSNFLNSLPQGHANRIEKVWPLFRTLYSMITSFQILAGEKKFDVRLVHTCEDLRFITSDQPVVNLAAIDLPKTETPSKAAFYFPISPDNALVFSDCDDTEYIRGPNLTDIQVDSVNRIMVRGSHTQIFAHEKSMIDRYS